MPGNPKVRYGVEVFPVRHEGRQLILVRDQMGLDEEPLLFTPIAAALLMHMNGENSLRDLQELVMRKAGQLLQMQDLEEVVALMDEHLLLENERFYDAAARAVARFMNDPVRRMRHAGKSYPGKADELRTLIEDFFSEKKGGPGMPEKHGDGSLLLGLVAPHIDLGAGGSCYACAYKALGESVLPKTWVILGTGHEPVENGFALTAKDFETPLGTLACDREFCEEFRASAPRDFLASEYNHQREHVIEFQTVFLSYFQPDARIVPLLCSFSMEERDADAGYIEETAALLRDIAARRGSVGFLASVDLAHIGPRYGDRSSPDSSLLIEHMAADRGLLETLERCDSGGFMEILLRERNRRRVCGAAPLYVFSRVLEGRALGRTLKHSYAIVGEDRSFVTFASMAFYDGADGSSKK